MNILNLAALRQHNQPPYICPKCGCTQIGMMYHPERHNKGKVWSFKINWTRFSITLFRCPGFGQEHIILRCSLCLYEWTDYCLDSQEAQAKQKQQEEEEREIESALSLASDQELMEEIDRRRQSRGF